MKQKLLTLMGQKNALAQETEQIESLLSEIDQYLNGKTRSELIAKSQGTIQVPWFFKSCSDGRIKMTELG